LSDTQFLNVCLLSILALSIFLASINIFSLVSVKRLVSQCPNYDSIHFVTSGYSGDPFILPLNTEDFSHRKPPSAVTSAVLRDTIKGTSYVIDGEFPNDLNDYMPLGLGYNILLRNFYLQLLSIVSAWHICKCCSLVYL